MFALLVLFLSVSAVFECPGTKAEYDAKCKNDPAVGETQKPGDEACDQVSAWVDSVQGWPSYATSQLLACLDHFSGQAPSTNVATACHRFFEHCKESSVGAVEEFAQATVGQTRAIKKYCRKFNGKKRKCNQRGGHPFYCKWRKKSKTCSTYRTTDETEETKVGANSDQSNVNLLAKVFVMGFSSSFLGYIYSSAGRVPKNYEALPEM